MNWTQNELFWMEEHKNLLDNWIEDPMPILKAAPGPKDSRNEFVHKLFFSLNYLDRGEDSFIINCHRLSGLYYVSRSSIARVEAVLHTRPWGKGDYQMALGLVTQVIPSNLPPGKIKKLMAELLIQALQANWNLESTDLIEKIINKTEWVIK